jgi:hypothetical protein
MLKEQSTMVYKRVQIAVAQEAEVSNDSPSAQFQDLTKSYLNSPFNIGDALNPFSKGFSAFFKNLKLLTPNPQLSQSLDLLTIVFITYANSVADNSPLLSPSLSI